METFEQWVKQYSKEISYCDLLKALRQSYKRKILIAMFSSSEAMKKPEAIRVFSEGAVIVAQVANIIHLDFKNSGSSALFYG